MNQRFEQLSEQEFDQLKDSIALITVLIAGADGKIDQEELDWAEKVAGIRTYSSTSALNSFYTEVGKDFDQKLKTYINELPGDTNQRTEAISAKLTALNPIFAKLDQALAYDLYVSLKSFGEHVAKASGGFMRFFSVSSEEKALMVLPMIDPISKPVETDESEVEENEI
jgi:hypothetical protein